MRLSALVYECELMGGEYSCITRLLKVLHLYSFFVYFFSFFAIQPVHCFTTEPQLSGSVVLEQSKSHEKYLQGCPKESINGKIVALCLFKSPLD